VFVVLEVLYIWRFSQLGGYSILYNQPQDMWPAFFKFALSLTPEPLSEFHFIKFRQLFSPFGQTQFCFTWGSYAAFHGMAQTCHIESSMINTL
jgi:hypothetical protein